MGNDQSRTSSGDGKQVDEKPPDYYELLQVDEEAGYDEIKVSWSFTFITSEQSSNTWDAAVISKTGGSSLNER